MRLTQKQERFARFVFEGMNQRKAYTEAGYTIDNMALTTLDANASRLANNAKVLARLEELRQKAEDASVATVLERKQKLTEILRGNLLDYQEIGADGGYLNIDKSKPNTGAIAEITTRTEYDKDGANAAVVTRVKLHSPIQAADLLNKMDKLYTDGNTTNIDARTVNIGVDDAKGKLLSALNRYITREGEAESPQLTNG